MNKTRRIVACHTCGKIQTSDHAPLSFLTCQACGKSLRDLPDDLRADDFDSVARIALKPRDVERIEHKLAEAGRPIAGHQYTMVIPLLWSGWEYDTAIVLVQPADRGAPVLVVLDGIAGSPTTESEILAMLRERMAASEEAIRLAKLALKALNVDPNAQRGKIHHGRRAQD